jgi:Lecithin retinol acyltransferase
MNSKSNFPLSFDPDAWELSVVAHRPRNRLSTSRFGTCDRPRRGVRPCDQALDAGREPPLGAHVLTPRHGYTHHAIYVGQGRVVQYGGLSRGLARGPVEEVPLLRFSHGRPIWIRVGEFGWKDQPEVVCRARSRLGENRYRVLTNNCEHFCEWCVRGQHHSYQVDELLCRYSRTWHRFIEPFARVVLRVETASISGSAASGALLR